MNTFGLIWGAAAVLFLAELFYFLRRRETPKHILRRTAASLWIPALFWAGLCVQSYFGRNTDLRPAENLLLTLLLSPLLLGPFWLVSFPPFLFRGASWKCFAIQGLLFGPLLALLWLK